MSAKKGNSVDGLFKERFERVLGAFESLRKAGDLVGYEAEQVAKWRDEKTKAPFLAIALLAKEADVSMEWLAFGGEEAQAKVRAHLGPHLREVRDTLKLIDNSDIVRIPILDVRAAAGTGSWNDRAETVGTVPFSQAYLRRLGIEPDKVHALRASGDSMFPTIADGALVLVDSGRREIVSDGIYVFVIEDFARIKRIQSSLDGGLVFISDNAALYTAERLARDQLESLEVIGRVFWAERVL